MNMEENMEETRVETTVEDRVGTRVEDRTEEPKAETASPVSQDRAHSRSAASQAGGHRRGEARETSPRLSEGDELPTVSTVQLQGLVVQLREGLHCALVELSELRQRTHCQEDTLQTHLRDVDHKIIGLKNSLNTFKEELGGAVLQVKEVSCRQREVQKKMELLHTHHSSQSRKSSKGDLLLGEGHSCLTSQSDLNVIQHYFSSTTNNNRSTASTQNRRQTAALELLESERVYVSYLSLLLKANISFNGSEALVTKDKRLFPSSLRFLIQQHLELLHTLQERVLKCQWQGIMGDVFMKLTSKESDFLDFYVSYLKELPDCLAVVSILTSSSANTAALLECDMMGDESRPSLHTLLLQPVQRIPQYTLLLQGLLRQTEADHPDYFLILVSIQQFRSFTSQYQQLLQHNQDLLHTTRKDREHVNQVKRSKQRLLDQIQSRTRTTYQDYQVYSDWDRDPEPEPQRYHKERSNALPYFSPEPAPAPPNLPYFSPEPAPPNPKQTGLRSIPESDAGSEASCKHHLNSRGPGGLDLHPGAAGSALAQALGEFLLPGETPEMEGLCEGDGVSLHDASVFDQCSSSSSDSSIDIAFVRCPKSSSASHRAVAANVPTSREAYGAALGQGGRYSKFPGRGCVSPDEAVMMRHSPHRPLQASQRKSKSLNGLQLDSTVSGVDAGPDHGHRRALERQGSNKGSGRDPGLYNLIPVHQDIGGQVWGEEPKWRGGADEMNHTPLSERSRKQEKGGFRSSFKRLFKKKSVEDKKEKSETSDHESSKTQRPGQLEADRGTAV
ncbi:unnamed protein product [Merluccius merluccius]